MHRPLRAALMAAVLVGVSLPAAAQSTPWEDRVFAGISFGFEAGTSTITDSRTFVVYEEPGSLQSTSRFDSDGIIDISLGARVWSNMGVAIGYHAKSTTGTAEVQGSIPHPIFYDRPRSFTDSIDGIDRDESATHVQIGWMIPVNDKVDVFVYAGPSFYRLKQEVVSDLAVAEQGPPFTSVVVQPTVSLLKENVTGYNVGADATYMLYTSDTLRFGLGGFLRFTGATANINLGDATTETDLGGVQFGVGARLRF